MPGSAPDPSSQPPKLDPQQVAHRGGVLLAREPAQRPPKREACSGSIVWMLHRDSEYEATRRLLARELLNRRSGSPGRHHLNAVPKTGSNRRDIGPKFRSDLVAREMQIRVAPTLSSRLVYYCARDFADQLAPRCDRVVAPIGPG